MPLLYLLIFLIPFPEYKRFTEVIGDMTLIKIVGMVTVSYAIFRHMSGTGNAFWPKGTQKNWFVAFFLLLFVVHFSAKTLADWSVHIALFYVIMVLVNSVETIIKMFWVSIAALLVNCFQSFKGVYLHHWYSRASGSFGDPNYFALALIVCIAFTLCLYRLYPEHGRLLAGIAVVLCFNLLLTSSRGGILGFGAMFVMFLKGSRKRATYITIAVGMAATLAVLIPETTVNRLLSKDRDSQGSTEHRMRLIKTSLRMIEDNPLTGVGYGNYKQYSIKYSPEETRFALIAHNSYLSVAAELGLPLLVLFIGLLVSSYVAINRIISIVKGNDRLENVSLSIKIAFSGYCISIVFLTAEREKYLWLMIFLIMALTKICHQNLNTSAKKVQTAPYRLV